MFRHLTPPSGRASADMTLPLFLYTLADADIKATIRQSLGGSQAVAEFADEFVAMRQFDRDPAVRLAPLFWAYRIRCSHHLIFIVVAGLVSSAPSAGPLAFFFFPLRWPLRAQVVVVPGTATPAKKKR